MKLRLGVIGCGARARRLLTAIAKLDRATVTCVADPEFVAVRRVLRAEGLCGDDTRFYPDGETLLEREEVDGILVGTRGLAHAEVARGVMRREIPLLLEKPVAVDAAGLAALAEAAEGHDDLVVVSFPFRFTPIIRLVKSLLAADVIGPVEHVQAVNNVPYGGIYYHHWFRDESFDGSLWLAKTTHDFDYLNHLLGLRPRWISAVESKRVFVGNHPAGLACRDCDEQRACPESPYRRFVRGELESPERAEWEPYLCSFAVDTGNHDSASAIIAYETGMHVTYSQNFFARRGAARRGATLLAYRGTLEFDCYQGRVTVHHHHSDRVDEHLVGNKHRHFGGDEPLAEHFVAVMEGREASASPLAAGILSALMCLKAREAAVTRAAVEIVLPARAASTA